MCVCGHVTLQNVPNYEIYYRPAPTFATTYKNRIEQCTRRTPCTTLKNAMKTGTFSDIEAAEQSS